MDKNSYLVYMQIFAHREAYEQVVSKSEEKLQRARTDYKRAYAALLNSESGNDQELKRAYLEAHNTYVLQLRATNAITERYQYQCLPGLLGEIAEVYEELCGLACNCIAGISDAAGERSLEQSKRFQTVTKEARAISSQNDLQASTPILYLLKSSISSIYLSLFVFLFRLSLHLLLRHIITSQFSFERSSLL